MSDPKNAHDPDGVLGSPETVEPTRVDTEGGAANALGAADSQEAADDHSEKEADSI